MIYNKVKKTKDILILGMPRTGKTTLATKLRKELTNYDLISCDCIRNMLSNCFPQLGVGPDKSAKKNEEVLPNCIYKLLKYNKKRVDTELGFIIEGAQILPDAANSLFKDSIVIFLGYGKKTPEELLKNIRKYDNEQQYTFKRSDDRILKELQHNVITDKVIQEKCKLYGYPYIDTTENRKAKLNAIIDNILKEIK